ncbi:MAG: ImmA/IrrE family metallo-endopeptidase [Armatimonadetes bacterium]|nr:ImmA/IrrE family metallo-endopeptidase [Armatimonadota bacterium]
MVTTTATAHNPMPELLRRLERFGFPERYVRGIGLPNWWDDEIATTPLGKAQALILLSRNLGLELTSLESDSAPIQPLDPGNVLPKKRRDASDEALVPTRCVAARLARLARDATATVSGDLPRSAAEVRSAVLACGSGCVDLPSLLSYCWEIGIPVSQLATLPPGGSKLDGLCAAISDGDGAFSIVLSNKRRFFSWLLFILAHELGHAVLGHLTAGSILFDDAVESRDAEACETAANDFAVEVLTGRPDTQITRRRVPKAPELVERAREAGLRHGVDPGAIVLNYVYHLNKTALSRRSYWPLAFSALGILDPNGNAPALVSSEMRGRLDWTHFTEETGEFVRRVSSVD